MTGLAYLAQGGLFVKDGPGEPRPVTSRFGETIVDRALQIERRHSWKTQGRGAQFMTGGMLWAAQPGESGALRFQITSLSRGLGPGELLYSLETPEIAGVFALQDGFREERRLFHGNDGRRLRYLAAEGGQRLIACSVRHEAGSASIAVMGADELDVSEVTEGDSVDLAPSWVPGGGRQLVFQSAGIGRDREGRLAAMGPSAIRRLDLGRGEVETLAEEKGSDLLGPRLLADGTLFYIRRPHAGGQRASLWGATKDFLLFPARLLYALFQWLNFFTVRYAGKPLTTAGGPRREADLKQMMIWGNLIDAERAARESRARGDDTPDLVPSSWQLVRRGQDGKSEVLARGVVSFDLAEDGSIAYTNGSAVYLLEAGQRRRLCLGSGIEQIVLLGEAAPPS